MACSPQYAMLVISPPSCWTRVCLQPVAHPSDSLEVAPSDFHMFGNIKINLHVQRFTSDDTVKSEAQKWLWVPDFSFLFQGQDGLTVRYNSLGDCVEEQRDDIQTQPCALVSPFTFANLKVG